MLCKESKTVKILTTVSFLQPKLNMDETCKNAGTEKLETLKYPK